MNIKRVRCMQENKVYNNAFFIMNRMLSYISMISKLTFLKETKLPTTGRYVLSHKYSSFTHVCL